MLQFFVNQAVFDVLNFEINLVFLIKPFSLHRKKVKTKSYLSWERKELLRWSKKDFFIIFEGLSIWNFLEGESLTLTKRYIIDSWKVSESEYTEALNMPGLHKVLQKTLYHKSLSGFWIFLRFWIWQSSKYAKITQDCEKTLHYRYLTGFWMCL